MASVEAPTSNTVTKRGRTVSVHLPEWLPEWLRKEGPARSFLPYGAILTWYAFNISVVLSNKFIFNYLPMPTGLTLLHQTTGFVLSTVILAVTAPPSQEEESSKPVKGGRFDRLVAMFPVALANTAAMYFSNLAMKLTSAPFTQTVKSLTPVLTYLIYKFYQKRSYSWENDLALVFVSLGVVVASSGDLSFEMVGLLTALIASAMTASNVVLSNDRLKKLSPLQAMNVMAPYSIAILLPTWLLTEKDLLLEGVDKEGLPYWDKVFNFQVFSLLMLHGVLVFLLNAVSQFKNAVVSPVLGTTSGNMKVVLIHIFSWLLLGTDLNIYIWIGSFMTIAGGVWFGLLKEGFSIMDVLGRGSATDAEKKDA